MSTPGGNPRSLMPMPKNERSQSSFSISNSKSESASASASASPAPAPALEATGTTQSSEESASKRRCISSACMPCRKRKSKCDGLQPSCHACTFLYNSPCNYDIDSDRRRKGALKRDISQLEGDLLPRNVILDAIRCAPEAVVDEIVSMIRRNKGDSWESIAQSVEDIRLEAHEKKPSADAPVNLDDYLVTDSANLSTTRQYGHTSHLNLLAEEEECVSGLSQFGPWTSVTDNADLIQYLLEVYFSWGHPIYTLFSEEAFKHGMQDRNMKYCTPLLMNAVLAIACHFTDRPDIRADQAKHLLMSNLFYAEAERIFRANSRPCLTTVQALGVMSVHQAMNNKDSSGWSLMCQTIGMAIELGLHKEPPPGKVTQTEIATRRVTLWGIYNVQTIWAICVGRITLLPKSAIRLEKPLLIDSLESRIWKPHGLFELSGGLPLEQAGYKFSLLRQFSTLCEINDDIVQTFYAPRERLTSAKLLGFFGKFRKWYTELPECMAIKKDSPTLPQVITLHVYYHTSVSQLFRPFLKVTFVQSQQTPRQICTQSAAQISTLLALYRRTYGYFRISFMFTHCTMTAAIIHLFTMAHSNDENFRIATEQQIVDAIHALHEMYQKFPIVERYLKSIRSLIQKWFPRIPPNIMSALQEADIASSPSSTSSGVPPEFLAMRKPSAPEILPPQFTDIVMAPAQNNSISQQTYDAGPFLWSPFQYATDGLPITLQEGRSREQSAQPMDITSLLDSGIDGDMPHWNRDGFTMGQSSDINDLPMVWEGSGLI